MKSRRTLGFATRAIHAEHVAGVVGDRGESIAMPLHQTASFRFEHTEEIARAIQHPDSAFVYSRLSNPTVQALERAVANLEGGEAAMAFASGMAAIHGVTVALCGAGDHIVAPASMYGGTYSLFKDRLSRMGIGTTLVRNGDADAVAQAIRPNTKMVYAETIANPALFVADLSALAKVAHARGVKLVVDSTFASPYLCRPIEHGVDVVVHSASKYLGGHGDLIAGMAVCSAAFKKTLWESSIDIGGTLAPFVAWLVLRGLKTLPLRMNQHSRSALQVAEFLSTHPRVERALYPALPSHPDVRVAERMLPRGMSGMVAFDLKADRATTTRVIDHLELFQRASSLGDTISLALQPAATSHRQLSPEELKKAGIGEGFVRLSVGLEDPEDLIDDLARALEAAE